MKHVRKVGLAVVSTVLSVGVIGLTVPSAHADIAWPCPKCFTTGR